MILRRYPEDATDWISIERQHDSDVQTELHHGEPAALNVRHVEAESGADTAVDELKKRTVLRVEQGSDLFDERHILPEADIINLELNVRAISTRSREFERVNVDNDEARLPDQIDREVSQGGDRVEGG